MHRVWAGDKLRAQCRISEAVLGTRLADIVFLIQEEVVVRVTRVAFARGDGDRVQMHAVDLRSLQDADVLKMCWR